MEGRSRPPLKTGHSRIRENPTLVRVVILLLVLGVLIVAGGLATNFLSQNDSYSDFKQWRQSTPRKIGIVLICSGSLLLIIALVLYFKRFLSRREHVSHHRRTISTLSSLSSISDNVHSSSNGHPPQQMTNMA